MQKGIYEHYKGNRYEVIDTVRHSENEELMVLYRPLYGEKTLWVRPYDMFFENVSFQETIIPRFKYIKSENEQG